MKSARLFAALALAALVAACGPRDQSNGGETPEQAAALNNAAEMLDTTSDSLATNQALANANENSGDTGEAAALDSESKNSQ